MINEMKYLQRLDRQYEKGLEHGLKGINKPGIVYGLFRRQYYAGRKQGLRLRPQKNKADLS